MSPDSLGLELTALTVTVLAALATAVLWGTARGRPALLVRCAAVATCVVTTAATGLIWANRQVDSYPTWASLFGSGVSAGTAVSAVARVPAHTGQVTSFTVAGRASHLTLPVYAYLPPGYDGGAPTRYPVIEALHGYPGSPLQWINRMNVASVLDREIDAGRMAPTVVLFPYQTPDPMRDTECTDIVGGPQAETFLTVDVPAAVRARLRVRTDAAGWGLAGYSAGGYCATDLLLRHPGEYTAAASLSGYAEPGIDVGNGTQFTAYDDLWRLRHLPVPAVSLYLACARSDRGSLRDTLALARAVRAPLTVTTAYVNGGGHNSATWEAMEAPAFDWLSNSLGRPVVPGSPGPGAAIAVLSGAPRG